MTSDRAIYTLSLASLVATSPITVSFERGSWRLKYWRILILLSQKEKVYEWIGILSPSFILTSCFSFMGQRLNVHWLKLPEPFLAAPVTSWNFCHVLLSHALHGRNKAVRSFHCEAIQTLAKFAKIKYVQNIVALRYTYTRKFVHTTTHMHVTHTHRDPGLSGWERPQRKPCISGSKEKIYRSDLL